MPKCVVATVCLLVSLGSSGCMGKARQDVPEIELQVGPTRTYRFAPRTALARYVEIPGKPDELKILIANYAIRCDGYIPPAAGEVLITATVRVPSGELIEPGEYPRSVSHEEFQLGVRGALPFVRLDNEGRSLPGGGHLAIDTLQKVQNGLVAGEFLFQDGGAGQPTTSGLRGAFQAKLCQVSLDESRKQAEL